jgi:MtrB/PioB family decaheme-associated outer membrane protein
MRGQTKVAMQTALAVLLASLLPVPAAAQVEASATFDEPATRDDDDDDDDEAEPLPPATGEVALGLMLFDQDGNSSKFNQYRDERSGLFIDRLLFDYDAPDSRRFVDFRGYRLGRDDVDLSLGFGSFTPRPGTRGWTVDARFSKTPNLLSNDARTPYQYLGGGRYQVARNIVDAIQISNIEDGRSWTAPDAGPGMPGEDRRIARVLADAVRPVELGTERETGSAGYTMFFSERTKAKVEFKSDARTGSIVTGAAIGDRPPRSMTVQLPEPIDHTTYDFKVAMEHVNRNYHVDASFTYSSFRNDVETLTWNSLFHAPGYFTPGATDYDGVRIPFATLYATQAAMALAPDNTAQQFVLNGGLTQLPFNGSLSATVARAVMEQDDDLLPYASSDFGGRQTPGVLPRSSADARIETSMLNVVYAANPLQRMSMRLHYRYYDLDNQTPQDAWLGNTQDTSSRPILSQRYNVGYDLTQQNLGADMSWYFGKAGTLGLAIERERKERPQREVATSDEDRYRLSWRVRPFKRATLNARYTRASRDGSPYDGEITDQTYAYDPFASAGAADNPVLGFGDHPGLRRFDVADRDRDEFNLSLAFMASDALQTRMSYNYRRNDYRTDIPSTINTWDAARREFVDAFVDPTQLGLLGDRSRRLAFDLSYAPNETLSFSAFASRESLDLDQRGRYLNENARLVAPNNSIAAGNMDWQNSTGRYIWDADITDRTNTVGVGFNVAPLGAGWDFSANLSHSQGTVGIDYFPGAYVAEDDTTRLGDHAEWSSPPDARFKTNTLSLHWRRELTDNWSMGLRYLFEIYRINDWQQQANTPHQNPLNPWFVAEFDPETAGSNRDRAGSRLVRLGDLLAPAYDVHVALLTFAYRW